MRNLSQVVRYEDASSLGTGCRLADPEFLGVSLHLVFQVDKFIWKDERLGNKGEVFDAMNLAELRYLPVHEILASHIKRAGKVIDFLVLLERLVNCLLYRSNRPEESPSAVVILVCLLLFYLHVTEAIILKSVADYLDVAVVEVEVVAIVLRQVRTDCDWVFIGAKH